jgi:hypothetical protein
MYKLGEVFSEHQNQEDSAKDFAGKFFVLILLILSALAALWWG